MIRAYTGNKEKPAQRVRAGTKAFIDRVIFLSEGAFFNNGDFVLRDIRGKQGQMSVHSTGRAVDLSYRKMGNKGLSDGRQHAVKWAKILSDHADQLGIEMIIDYYPEPHGRAYRCDRDAWQNYTVHTVSGAPHGDWLHVELSPHFADNPAVVIAAFESLFPAAQVA